LLPADLEILGLFLFGPRWQCPMARAINRCDRLVRSWVAEERPISIAASRLIEQLTRDKHGAQMKQQRAAYLDMIGSLSSSAIRGRLLAMDLSELHLEDHLRRLALQQSAPALVIDLAQYRRADPAAHRNCTADRCAVPSTVRRFADYSD
jgi:hypothetical protein